MAKYMVVGEFEHYHGEAVNPRHLSTWERYAPTALLSSLLCWGAWHVNAAFKAPMLVEHRS
jgi:hypothetical protein